MTVALFFCAQYDRTTIGVESLHTEWCGRDASFVVVVLSVVMDTI